MVFISCFLMSAQRITIVGNKMKSVHVS